MSRLYSHPREYRKTSWRIIYVLVSCQGIPSLSFSFASEGKNKNPLCLGWFSLLISGVFQWPLTLIVLQKYRDTNGRRIVIQSVWWRWCIYFLPRGGHTSVKVSRSKWEVYHDTFQSIGFTGRFDSGILNRRTGTGQRGFFQSFSLPWSI